MEYMQIITINNEMNQVVFGVSKKKLAKSTHAHDKQSANG
jgi:hypothetical protein